MNRDDEIKREMEIANELISMWFSDELRDAEFECKNFCQYLSNGVKIATDEKEIREAIQRGEKPFSGKDFDKWFNIDTTKL